VWQFLFGNMQSSRLKKLDKVEDVRRFISSMVPTAIDPNNSLQPHLLAIFHGDLLGEGDDSRNSQYLRGANYRWEEHNSPDA
jgi:hypothetical protein